MTRKELAKAVYEASHLTGEFKLRSGAFSNEYFDKYRFESNPALLRAIAKEMAKLIPTDVEILAGLELGGVPIATALSLETNIPAAFVRKKAKDYGTMLTAEGAKMLGKRVLIVEDVITSGGQVALSANDIRSEGGIIVGCVCAIDRQSGGSEALSAANIALYPLFTMADLKAHLQ